MPINRRVAILPQLRRTGRVSRGYIGVALSDVDAGSAAVAEARRSTDGALVQDVTAGSPAERAGLRPYDVIVASTGAACSTNEELIREISARQPGTAARLRVLRDGRGQTLTREAGRAAGRGDDVGPAAERRQPAPGRAAPEPMRSRRSA